MNQISKTIEPARASLDPRKFTDPDVTASGAVRASVTLGKLETLWFNTGTLCNIECGHCYIASSPINDRLSYLTLSDVSSFLDEIETLGLGTREIGFTGGEPFMNPDIFALLEASLKRGYEVLVLTNAMQPMQRSPIQNRLLELNAVYGDKLTLRVSLDHYTAAKHDVERGPGAFSKTFEGLQWLVDHQFCIDIAGRTCWDELEPLSRAGYERLSEDLGLTIDAYDPTHLILFPEMDENIDVPEITTECWDILGKNPSDVMCASSRMIVKRKGASQPQVLPCTLLPYDTQFEMGETLAQSLTRTRGAIDHGAVKLNHPNCAKFCVLGGGSCTVS